MNHTSNTIWHRIIRVYMGFSTRYPLRLLKVKILNKTGLPYSIRVLFAPGVVILVRVSSYSDLLTHAGMTSLYNMRLQDIAIFMFKIRNRLLPHNILELFSPSPSDYNLRNSDFHVQRVKTVKYGKHSLRFLGHFYGQN